MALKELRSLCIISNAWNALKQEERGRVVSMDYPVGTYALISYLICLRSMIFNRVHSFRITNFDHFFGSSIASQIKAIPSFRSK